MRALGCGTGRALPRRFGGVLHGAITGRVLEQITAPGVVGSEIHERSHGRPARSRGAVIEPGFQRQWPALRTAHVTIGEIALCA